MTEYIHYFWVGFDSMGRFPLFRNAFIFLCCVVLVIVIRRLTASFRSGGSFFEAYRIAEGNFYIHGAIHFGPRTVSYTSDAADDKARVGLVGSCRLDKKITH